MVNLSVNSICAPASSETVTEHVDPTGTEQGQWAMLLASRLLPPSPPKSQNQNAIRVSSSQDVGSVLLWSWVAVVQPACRRQLSGVAYGLSNQ